MEALRYQLKSVGHDKFCLMTFLLPIVIAAVLNLAGSLDLSSLGELHFGVLENDLPVQAITWLELYGPVMVYTSPKELVDAVNEPSTNLIGVTAEGNGIKTMLSGDEIDIFLQTADILPGLYEQRNQAAQIKVQVLEHPNILAGYQDMFIAVTLMVAMFMGCTFNAMNIISEKEDGIAYINEILPMTYGQYMMQKISVGFICGSLSSIIAACICFRLSGQIAALMLVLIIFSSFVAALIGLLLGRISDGLMVGVIYIKIVMLVFMAVPIISFLVGISNPFLSAICYLVPSQAAFEGIMGLLAGNLTIAVKDVFILLAHSLICFCLYLSVSKWKGKNL